MKKQTGTTACIIRDKLIELRCDKKITLDEITERLAKMEITEQLQGEIIQMVEYRKLERTTNPIEQAMFSAICDKIITEIL